MIKSITLKNFFSFEEQTVRLNPKVNLLVGINGSGKSNFIKAFELLRFGINEGTMQDLITSHWGNKRIWNLGDIKQEKPIEFEFSIDKENFLNGKKELEDLLYGLEIKDSCYFEEKLKISGEVIQTRQGVRVTGQSTNDNLLDDSWVISDRNIGKFKNLIKQIEIYENIDISKQGAQQPNKLENRENYNRLSPLFNNLAGLLNTMSIKPETEEAFDKIYQSINNIHTYLEGVHFGLNGNKELYIQIKNLPQNLMMGLENVSSGTIKFLVLMSILYNPNRGNIVCIEEPEDDLHPDMINAVAEGIKHAAETSQMVISTHSPFLLNAFKLEDILVFKNDKNNNTVVTELSQKDFGEWKHSFTAGQAWLNGLIGGTRW